MPRDTFQAESSIPDEAYQERILPHVSRTFALTIPQLPPPLRSAVTSAYLLCRIADTVEDDPAIPPAHTHAYLQRFAAVVAGAEPAAALSREVGARLSERTLPAERDLVINMERVVRTTLALSAPQRAAIQRCIELMCYGMHHFQQTASLAGLARASDLDSYCYYVAGVVGEMLTELFCAHSPLIAERRLGLREHAVSFGQGLQMTNILKDIWEDRSRGACWLPQELFQRHGVDLAQLAPEHYHDGFGRAYEELIAVAHAHLRNALEFTLLIPSIEPGIRRFCLWAVGLAVLTLQRIHARPRFTAGAEVKVSHAQVALVRLLTGVSVRSDSTLRRLFDRAAAGLPLAVPADVRRASRVAAQAAQQLRETTSRESARESFAREFARARLSDLDPSRSGTDGSPA